MSDASLGRLPEEGTPSADGSRVWDGRFWVLTNPGAPMIEISEPIVRHEPTEVLEEPRGAYVGGVIFASVVAAAMTYLRLSVPAMFVPPTDSLVAALHELFLAIEIWNVLTFVLLVAVLSIGRQGIDVLLLRSMVVAVVFGIANVAISPVWFVPDSSRLKLIAAFGILFGPALTLFATVANLVWYRSFSSLRPQLGIFNRRPG